MIIEGIIATHDRKKFLGQIKISNSTGLIVKVTKGRKEKADYIFNSDNIIFPGMGDVHIHAREDQTGKQNYKEEYKTAGDAAISGGCVHVSAMPNTPQPLVRKSDFQWHRNRIKTLNHPVSILNYIGIDSKTKPLGKPGEHFYKLYFGKSIGDLTVMYGDELDVILERYKKHHISFHVEYEPIIQAHLNGNTHSDRRPVSCVNEGLRILLPLVEKYKIRAKLCHWSTGGESFKLIKEYQNKGCYITLEVSPLHLLFDTKMTDKDPSLWLKIQMNPAIQSTHHRRQLIEGLKEGFIGYLATDHAPHTEEEKYSAFSKYKKRYPKLSNKKIAGKIRSKSKKQYFNICRENGMSGAPWLDTYALICIHLMDKYDFSTQDICRIASYNPGIFVNPHLKRQFSNKSLSKGFGAIEKGYVGSLTVLNLKKKTIVKRSSLKTKVGWSPLEGRSFKGAVEAVFVGGKLLR